MTSENPTDPVWYFDIRRLSQTVFAFVLGQDAPPGNETLQEAIRLGQELTRTPFSTAERVVFWGYLYAVERAGQEVGMEYWRQCGDCAGKMKESVVLLPDYETAIQQTIDMIWENLTGLRPSELIHSPPRLLIDVLDQLAIAICRQDRAEHYHLKRLSVDEFRHPDDGKNAQHLRLQPIWSSLYEAATNLFYNITWRNLLSNAIEVNPLTLPYLYRTYWHAVTILGIEAPPKLFICEGGIGAALIGTDSPIIQLESRTIDILDEDEMLFLLGRELGHWIAGHGPFLSVLNLVSAREYVSESCAALLPDWNSITAYHWQKAAMCTADRVGLLVCQNEEIVLRTLMKLAGYPARYTHHLRTRSLREQSLLFYRQFVDYSSGKQIDMEEETGEAAPFMAYRTVDLLNWFTSDYRQIITRNRKHHAAYPV